MRRFVVRNDAISNARTLKHGNPTCYNTFVDEALNRTLRTAGQHAHRSRMSERMFRVFDIMGEYNLSDHIFGAGTD